MKNFSVRSSIRGIGAAAASACFLGMAPVFGKLAIALGMPPLFVVAMRTILAAGLFFLFILIFKRPFLYIYPAGLLVCVVAGWINGMGSLLYYSALGRLDATLGQVIYSLYPLFVAMWLWLDRQPPSRLTVIRLLMTVPGLLLLTQSGQDHIDLLAVGMMLVSSMLYALHLPINQRVLYDMPAPTVTLYTLLAMAGTVTTALFFVSFPSAPYVESWGALLALTAVTFLSRLTLFMGVKSLGGLQTALLGLGELLITIILSHWMLHERLNFQQWLGLIVLVISLCLVFLEKPPKKKQSTGGFLSWFSSPPDMPTGLRLD